MAPEAGVFVFTSPMALYPQAPPAPLARGSALGSWFARLKRIPGSRQEPGTRGHHHQPVGP